MATTTCSGKAGVAAGSIAGAPAAAAAGIWVGTVAGVIAGAMQRAAMFAAVDAAVGSAVGATARVAMPATAGTVPVSAEWPAHGASAQPSLELLIKASTESESLSCRSSTGVLTA